MLHLTDQQLFLGQATYLSIIGTYLGAISLFYGIEHAVSIKRLQRPPTTYEVEQCFRMVAINLTWLFFATHLAGPVLEQALANYEDQFPSYGEAFIKLCLFFVVDDCWFYFYHRFVHSVPRLYVAVHKQHHIFTAPFPAVAFAVHPFEMMLQAFGTCLAPLGIFYGTTHPILFWTFLVIRQLQGIEDHLGYELAWSPTHYLPAVFGGTKFHDLHHQTFKCNYASMFSFIDRLFGTAAAAAN
jgi:sterol desaturase/sphingolipid hydroxylase (fatty acid hydroxylase superfamily)